MSTLEECSLLADQGSQGIREAWNNHLGQYNTMKLNYEEAIQTYNSKKKWTVKLMKAVLPVLKRPGDPPRPDSIQKGLDVYFQNMIGRIPLSFQEYIHWNKFQVPSNANVFNPLPLDVLTGGTVMTATKESTDSLWAEAQPMPSHENDCKPKSDAVSALLALGVDDVKNKQSQYKEHSTRVKNKLKNKLNTND